MIEVWDAYDRTFHRIENRTLVRGEPLPEGIYHLVCDVMVKHADGSYLLMQRDIRKHHGGMWELTVGALRCGERNLWTARSEGLGGGDCCLSVGGQKYAVSNERR